MITNQGFQCQKSPYIRRFQTDICDLLVLLFFDIFFQKDYFFFASTLIGMPIIDHIVLSRILELAEVLFILLKQ